MKPLKASFKLAVLLGMAIISAAFGAKNTQIQILALEQISTGLLKEISTASTFAKTSPKSLGHQDVQLMPMPLGGSSAPTSSTSTVVAANLGGTIVTILLVGGVIVTVGAIAVILRPKAIVGLVTIAEDEVGIAIKKFTFIRRTRSHPLVALNQETGVQAKTLEPGSHWLYWSWMYTISKVPVIRILKEEVGLVVANDGASMKPGQMFGQVVECNNFQDAEAFIKNGGHMGKQLAILRAGTYRINTELFKIRKVPVIRILPEEVGLVIASDGAPMKPGQMFGQVVECNNFQDARAFIDKGGQQGKQLAILTAGIYQINTELFSIRQVPVIRVPQGQIALVIANDGAPLPPGRILGDVVECNNFQDAQAFIDKGGKKGRQLAILTSGAYQINTELFKVITAANAAQHDLKPEQLQVYTVEPDKIGIVTTHDGLPLSEGQIAGSLIEGHNKFQDGQKFIDRGGYKGLQEEVLTEGSWHLNPWFVTIEQVPVTKIEAGTVGVVVSSVGKEPEQDAVDSQVNPIYKLVEREYKGIWKIPLEPGDHHINTRIMRVEIVPTHEIRLNWSDDNSKPEYNYDKNLGTLELRSKDQYSFKVELTQHISITPEDAPKMISKIGSVDVEESKISNSSEPIKKYRSIKNLVIRVLTPLVNAYFQDSAQDYEALDFRRERSQRQTEATEYIKGALNNFGVQARGTFITKIDLPPELEERIQRIKQTELERDVLEEEEKTEKKRQQFVAQQEKTKIQSELTRKQEELKIAELENQKKIQHANTDAQFHQITNQARLEVRDREAKAKTKWKELINQVELGALREKTQIEAELQRLLSEVDVNKLLQTIEKLSPDLYAKMKADEHWAKAFGSANVPNTIFGTLGNNAGTSDGLQAMLPQLLTMQLFEQFKQPNSTTQLGNSPTPELPKAVPTELPKLKNSSLKALEPRCPVVLLLDTSSSISDECINELIKGIATLKREIEQDPNASRRVEIAVITIGGSEKVAHDFAAAHSFSPPHLVADGITAMGKGIKLTLNQIENCLAIYENKNIKHYRPWVLLIAGSTPADSMQNTTKLISQAVSNYDLNFLVVGIESVNINIFSQFAPPSNPPLMLDGWKFKELFHWLADALKKVSRSEVDAKVKLPPINEWARIDGLYRQ